MILFYFVAGMLLFYIPFSIIYIMELVSTIRGMDSRIDRLVTYLREVTKDDID